ncbi:MAG: aspartate/glutamate racemase family protein [Spirochaetales bacterium]|nr:aspartate/glutamate racemase family protein [Spirochaetales bacterium]
MSTVTAIYTGPALVAPVKAYFSQQFPGHKIINVLDDGLIGQIIEAGKMTSPVLRQIYSYCREAADSGSDIILQTCSSVGQSVEYIQPFFDIPILRIDTPMSLEAVEKYKRIGVLATLPSTLEPTMSLVNRMAAEKGLSVDVVNGLARGAFEELSAGNAEAHDRMILDTAMALNDSCDVFLLAQGSMARMKDDLEKASGKPVLTSPESGVDALASYLKEGV